MSSHHCLLTEIRNHALWGERGPPSVWNERCCSQQKTPSTTSFNYCISALLEGLRGARERSEKVHTMDKLVWCLKPRLTDECWGFLMNLRCQCFHVLVINSSVSAMMHSRAVLCAVDGRIQPSLLIAPVLSPPPETLPDQITPTRPWWNHGTKSSVNPTTFTWFSSIRCDVIKSVWSWENRSCRELTAGWGVTRLTVWDAFLKFGVSNSWLNSNTT